MMNKFESKRLSVRTGTVPARILVCVLAMLCGTLFVQVSGADSAPAKKTSERVSEAKAKNAAAKKAREDNLDPAFIKLPGQDDGETAPEPEQKKEATIILQGDIDGEGTFLFQNDRITYRHSRHDYPKDVLINGMSWKNLDKPFELDFIPDYASTKVTERAGRNTIKVTISEDDVELYLYDTDSSSSWYQVTMQFTVAKEVKKDKKAKKEAVAEHIRNEDRLPAVFYNLRRSSSGVQSALIRVNSQASNLPPRSILSNFVLGHWMNSTDPRYIPLFRDLNQYYCYPVNRYDSFFYRSFSGASIQSFFNDSSASSKDWVAIHAGYVVAPFSGTFRFVGYGDDALAVQFDNKLVFDYGKYTLGADRMASNATLSRSGNSVIIQPTKVTGGKKDLYTNVETCTYEGHTLAKGLPIQVKKGTAYPIKILYAGLDGGSYFVALFIEMLNANGQPVNEGELLLFRTTSETPKSISGSDSASSDEDEEDEFENSPIWNVTDSLRRKLPTIKSDKVEKLKF